MNLRSYTEVRANGAIIDYITDLVYHMFLSVYIRGKRCRAHCSVRITLWIQCMQIPVRDPFFLSATSECYQTGEQASRPVSE